MAWLVRFALLFGLWALLVGTTAWLELVAGLAAAALAATGLTVARRTTDTPHGPDWRLLLRAWRVPLHVVADTAVLVRVLARGERAPGAYRTVELGARDPSRRATATLLASIAPNTLVVDVDERGRAVLHDLDPGAARGTVL